MPVRVVIADDAVLLREGLVRLLAETGHEVVAAVGDGPTLVAAVVEHRPDVSIVDVRMPPSHTDEGLRAAVEARRAVPGTPILVLSQYVEVSYADDLLADRPAAGSATCSRTGSPRSTSSSTRCAGWRAAAPCSTRRWSAQLFARRRRDDPLRS